VEGFAGEGSAGEGSGASATATFYRFVALGHPASWRARIEAAARECGLLGTVLLAGEGINATLWGPEPMLARFLAGLEAWRPFAGLHATRTPGPAAPPFRRLRVRVKREIVTLRTRGVRPAPRPGRYLGPEAWNAVLDDPAVPVIDVRNRYETAVGGFRGAVDPGIERFVDFKRWASEQLHPRRTPALALYCTGGIRCEKASEWLLQQGFASVAQLDGGILRYLATTPASEPRCWGECFVFDERVSVAQGLARGSLRLCRACRRPLTIAERAAPEFDPGVACPHCHRHLDAERRGAFAERRRQVELARLRGTHHLAAPERRGAAAERGPHEH